MKILGPQGGVPRCRDFTKEFGRFNKWS